MADQIHFDAARLARGIAYHVHQLGQPHLHAVRQVTADSLLHLWIRLHDEGRTAAVSKWQWGHMNDRLRFAWLMVNSKTKMTCIADTQDEDGRFTADLVEDDGEQPCLTTEKT